MKALPQIRAEIAARVRALDAEREALVAAHAELIGFRDRKAEGEMWRAAYDAESRKAAQRKAEMKAEINREAKKLLDPRQQAGEENIKRVEAYLAHAGRAFQADIRADCGLATGTDTWVMRALVEEGKARETGEKRRRSKEFAYVGLKVVADDEIATAPVEGTSPKLTPVA